MIHDLGLGEWASLALVLTAMLALGWAELRDHRSDDDY